MAAATRRGQLIVFEGMDGCGKTSIIWRTVERLQIAMPGTVFTVLRNPGGTPIGEALRDIALRSSGADWWTQTLVFAAARHEVCTRCIEPALVRGEVVICDRFINSSLVYQGYATCPKKHKPDVPFAQCMHVAMIGDLDAMNPSQDVDLTIYVDASVSECERRIAARGSPNALDSASHEFRERVYDGYQRLLRDDTTIARVANGDGAMESAVDEATRLILEVMQRRAQH